MSTGIEFHVIDKQTGEVADMEQIALTEEWAKDLIYCDMEDFAIQGNGTLILMDECGQFAYCPADRFEVRRGPDPDAERKYEEARQQFRAWNDSNIERMNQGKPYQTFDEFLRGGAS